MLAANHWRFEPESNSKPAIFGASCSIYIHLLRSRGNGKKKPCENCRALSYHPWHAPKLVASEISVVGKETSSMPTTPAFCQPVVLRLPNAKLQGSRPLRMASCWVCQQQLIFCDFKKGTVEVHPPYVGMNVFLSQRNAGFFDLDGARPKPQPMSKSRLCTQNIAHDDLNSCPCWAQIG